jgi:uncharacterized membrane protein
VSSILATTRRVTPYALAAILGVAGVAHFVAPEPFTEIVPRGLPLRRELVYASGLAELACAGLLVARRTRRMGGLATAVLLVAVFPANVQMALDRGGVWWLRLPLQVPLIAGALDVWRTSESGR